MFDLLILNKKPSLIREKSILFKAFHEPEITDYSTDPVILSMKRNDYRVQLPGGLFSMNSERVLIRFFGNFPSLFNKVVIPQEQKEQKCLNL